MSQQPGTPRFCDLVMKGGITSGVIYPSAAVRLAEVYTFRNIGGTSAGAIAAAVTAAAEYGRQSGNAGAFEKLGNFPSWIGAPGRLFGMFAPDRATRPLFDLITVPLKAAGGFGRLLALAATVFSRFLPAVAAGVLAAGLIGWWAASTGAGTGWGLACAVMIGLLVFGACLGILVWRQFTRAVPQNFYGLSKAFDPNGTKTDGPLTNWLTMYLDQLAGKQPAGPPLTFGDLTSRDVNLQVMTTALNLGRPYRLPFEDRIFYFCPEEFRALFPARVVDHMVNHEPPRGGVPPRGPGGKTLVAFPDAEQLPVVVATRMSLSFPILLAAVPLYAVDYTRIANQHPELEAPLAERCWFSDGGECSNLPIHFFDAPIPEWPTFAINLKDFHPDYPDEKDAVWLPMRNDAGWRSQWTRFEKPGEPLSVFGFLGAILSSMQNWQDNTLSLVPGYRDRIVSVSLRPDEGSYNLNMDKATVDRLSDRGKRAGEALVARFYQGGGWPNHVWLRFRSCAQLTGQWLRGVAPAAAPGIQNWIDRDAPSYAVPEGMKPDFHRGAGAILEAAGKIGDAATAALDDHAPGPEPQLCIRPKI
jgi:hypothetical protein